MRDSQRELVPAGNRRKVQKAATREKVLSAARVVFAGGYEQATIRGIAAAAGVSTGAIFASFTDKAALYREVFGHPPITPETGLALLRSLHAPDSPAYRKQALAMVEAG